MATLTLEIPDDLMESLSPLHDRLPELLQSCIQPSPALQAYQYFLDFLTSQPTPTQIASFRPTPAMQERLRTLLDRNANTTLTPIEAQELESYERLEHLVILLKAGNLPFLQAPSVSA
ncbi:MAG: hypothetical protein ACO331_03495 [Prochlorothrix sp.]